MKFNVPLNRLSQTFFEKTDQKAGNIIFEAELLIQPLLQNT